MLELKFDEKTRNLKYETLMGKQKELLYKIIGDNIVDYTYTFENTNNFLKYFEKDLKKLFDDKKEEFVKYLKDSNNDEETITNTSKDDDITNIDEFSEFTNN
jgi:hypothetical protein